jgi:hypothetical protein
MQQQPASRVLEHPVAHHVHEEHVNLVVIAQVCLRVGDFPGPVGCLDELAQCGQIA